jgi:hypothetical protein
VRQQAPAGQDESPRKAAPEVIGVYSRPRPRSPRSQAARTLDAIVGHANRVEAVFRDDVGLGDAILVRTKNSTYCISAGADGSYFVSGGWFDHQGRSPARVAINGCTWGGSSIHERIVAAPGLFLEFGNGVTTTRIQEVRLVPVADGSIAN